MGRLGRRLGILVLVILTCVVSLEAFSYLAVWMIEGRFFSPGGFREDLAALSRGEEYPASRGNRQRRELPSWVRNKVLHPYLGYVFQPRENAGDSGGEESLGITDFGYVDSAPPIRRRSEEKVIVGVLGGSVAMGFGKSPVATAILAEALEHSPPFRGKQVEFVRLAISGYHQPQQLLTLSYLLSLGAEFDLVINLDGFNEIALHPTENAKMGVFPAYPRSWYLYVENLPSEIMEPYHVARLQRRLIEGWLEDYPLRYSMTANLLWSLADRRLASREIASQENVAREAGRRRSYVASGPRKEYASRQEMMRDLVGLWKQSSIQLNALCRANGIKYFHALQPSQYVPDSKPLSARERRRAFHPEHPARASVLLGYPMLRNEGRSLTAEGVRFLDLTGVFKDHEESIYIDSLCHFNEEGFEIVATALADFITADL